MPVMFPHSYESTISRVAAGRAQIEAPPRPPLMGGPPPEFRGDPQLWSPEHLLCSALGLCLFATFEALAGRHKLEIVGWVDKVTGVLDRTADGLAFTSFTIALDLTVDRADIERARELIDRAKATCIVTRALAVPITVDAHIWEHDNRAHA